MPEIVRSVVVLPAPFAPISVTISPAATLREIADQAPGLSESERSSLASDLESAAAAMTDDGQNLATAAQDAAEGLREGGPAAQEGMEGIADAVEEAGASITPSEALDEAMQEAQQSQQGASASQSGASESGTPQESRADALVFVKWIGDKSLAWTKTGKMPAKVTTLESADFKALPEQAIVATSLDYVHFPPALSVQPQVDRVVQTTAEAYYAGQVDVDTAVQMLVDGIREELAKQ